MNLLAAAAAGQPDYIALGMLAVLIVILIVMIIRKKIALSKPKEQPAVQSEPVAVRQDEAPGSAGQIKLYNVEPKTAAMVMAIVADKLHKPLNELRFISIKEVE